jgi:hypothetical protein
LQNVLSKNFPAYKIFQNNFKNGFQKNFPAAILKKPGPGPLPFTPQNPFREPPFRNPHFRSSDHPQSGPCTSPDSLLFRSGALYGPGLGPSDPLFRGNVLEDLHTQGVWMHSYDERKILPSEYVPFPVLRAFDGEIVPSDGDGSGKQAFFSFQPAVVCATARSANQLVLFTTGILRREKGPFGGT